MSRQFAWSVILLMLVGVPIGTWYYLQKGVEYRMSELAVLTPKDSITTSMDTMGIVKGHTSIILLKSPGNTDEFMKLMDVYFKEAPRFQLLTVDTINDQLRVLPEGYISNIVDKYKDYAYLLVDEDGMIRNTYKSDTTDIQRMIEQTAIVLPLKKDSKIGFKK
ncbi:MAG: hypothetical protein J5I52_09370 [Saprospiraceae bacterium]|nr:MAG: hypothetical protein UZ09_BCD002000200 [Bacteroidetes bacterium OLB9]MCO6464346.1 hypothetical protein [Saprospiraceae bacterium]MCZ2337239.1 hypothetical protein [Chitinophagales bacterium]